MKRNPQPQKGAALGPPSYSSSFTIMKKKFQFIAQSGGTTSLSLQSLGDLWCTAATSTTAYQLASHFRLRRIRIWSPNLSANATTQIYLDWAGSTAGVFGKSNRVAATTINPDQPAYLDTRPPPDSQIAGWMAASGGAVTICNVQLVASSVMEITIDFVLRDDGSAQNVTAAVSGAVAGVNYIRRADSTSLNLLVPIGYQSI
jgi:hypothetical protein